MDFFSSPNRLVPGRRSRRIRTFDLSLIRDIVENPYVEVSVASPAYAWIGLSGKAVFEDSREAKEMCMGNPIVKSQYQTADNPIFVVFYLEEARAVLADFSGNPPREYQF